MIQIFGEHFDYQRFPLDWHEAGHGQRCLNCKDASFGDRQDVFSCGRLAASSATSFAEVRQAIIA